jgi:RsiW-degrading membrane proteinase PrsW (M82 family)
VLGLTWRQVTLAAAISMTVAVAIAIYVESIGAAYAVVLLLVQNGAFGFASNSGDVFDTIGEADLRLTENEQFLAGLFTASVLAPLSEEFGKSLGVRFMMRPHTTRAQCFLLGAFAGAGFGFLEALLYGLTAIGEDLESWWAIMLLRGGSTSLHVICTGLAGVGWWYWSRARRHGVAATLFGIAVLIHAGWNAFATVLYSRILFLDTIDSTLLDIVSYGIIAVISAAMIIAIPIVARRLRERIAPAEGTPLGSMTPWLG